MTELWTNDKATLLARARALPDVAARSRTISQIVADHRPVDAEALLREAIAAAFLCDEASLRMGALSRALWVWSMVCPPLDPEVVASVVDAWKTQRPTSVRVFGFLQLYEAVFADPGARGLVFPELIAACTALPQRLRNLRLHLLEVIALIAAKDAPAETEHILALLVTSDVRVDRVRAQIHEGRGLGPRPSWCAFM